MKEKLRMKFLAGLITENQYKQLLEDMEVVDSILDKISTQGKDSLSSEEKEYLDRYSRGEKDLIKPTSGETKVYVGVPYNEIFKIENFPAIPSHIKRIDFDCEDTDYPETCKNYGEMQELLKKSPKLKPILNKILIEAFGENNGYFHGLDFAGNFTSPPKIIYAQVSGDSMLYFVSSLSEFSEKYQSEEGWGVKSWEEI